MVLKLIPVSMFLHTVASHVVEHPEAIIRRRNTYALAIFLNRDEAFQFDICPEERTNRKVP